MEGEKIGRSGDLREQEKEGRERETERVVELSAPWRKSGSGSLNEINN